MRTSSSRLIFPSAGRLPVTLPMAEAVEFVLRSHDFRAGRFRLGYQSCDDATDQYGIWDAGKCRGNAKGYARNPAVMGVIGPLNSVCAAEMLPDPEPRTGRTGRARIT